MSVNLYRPRRGMSDSAFEEWCKQLVIVGEEAFMPGVPEYAPPKQKPIQTCSRCGEQYVRPYADHVDAKHNDAGRTAYWREYARRRRSRGKAAA